MWTLNEARLFINEIQSKLLAKNYHVVLGGSVLNDGQSENDLDLYFLPLEDESKHPDDRRIFNYISVMEIMHEVTGHYGNHMEDYENLRSTYECKLMYKTKDGKKIDAFIV